MLDFSALILSVLFFLEVRHKRLSEIILITSTQRNEFSEEILNEPLAWSHDMEVTPHRKILDPCNCLENIYHRGSGRNTSAQTKSELKKMLSRKFFSLFDVMIPECLLFMFHFFSPPMTIFSMDKDTTCSIYVRPRYLKTKVWFILYHFFFCAA